jgi:flagellar hook-associated protein 1
MAGLALDSALSGLRIAQQQLGVISTNIANAQTVGYSRKILPQSVQVLSGEAIGVTGEPVIRKVDLFLTRDLWTQVASVGGLDTKVRYLEQVQEFHGPPDAARTISADLAGLKNKFSALSDDPTNTFLQSSVIAQAQSTAQKFNDFAALVTRLRNDADTEIGTSVAECNSLMEQIANLNKQIKSATAQERTTATFADQRDIAVKRLAENIEISSFVRSDGVLVIQNKTGTQLVDENSIGLYFEQSSLGPDQFYPNGAKGVFLGGNPATDSNSVDLITFGLGGKLGALIELRDTTLPSYQAQIDELAYRTAQRFNNEGLLLFTDPSGQLPADTAPVPNPPGPLTPVSYVGFATTVQVNQNIVNDTSLLQKGTNGDILQVGSNEVIRRVLNFTYGDVHYQNVNGSRDIRVNAAPAGDTLQENFGLYSSNLITSSKNLAQYTTDINLAPGNPFTSATVDDFTIRIFDTRTGADSGTITIDLATAATAYPIGSAGVGAGIGTVDNSAEQLASYVNSLVWPASLNVAASVNQYGQFNITTRGNVTIGNGGMGTDGLNFLGLAAGTTNTTDPYFDVQVGNNTPVRITLDPTDDETDLVNKIDAVPGIDTADIVIDANGFLSFHPESGGDIKLIGGPFTSVVGFSTVGGNSIIKEIFGSDAPVVNVAHASFRSINVGPDAARRTGISATTSLLDYGQKLVNAQSADQTDATQRQENEVQYRDTLEKQLVDQSGVNIDEELANLIVIQTAYSAAARAMSTVSKLLDDLMNAI